MILFHNVVQVFPLDHFDGDRAAKAFQHLVQGLDASRVSFAIVDDNLSRKAVDRWHPGEEFGGGGFVSTLRKHEIKRLAVLVDSSVKIADLVRDDRVRERVSVIQSKTKRPVQFELSENTRDTIAARLRQM